jgi:hypothetical protein
MDLKGPTPQTLGGTGNTGGYSPPEGNTGGNGTATPFAPGFVNAAGGGGGANAVGTPCTFSKNRWSRWSRFNNFK